MKINVANEKMKRKYVNWLKEGEGYSEITVRTIERAICAFEESLLLGVLAADSLHGRALVRLDASFCLDSKKRSCVVDAAIDVGRAIARIFTGCEPHWRTCGRARKREWLFGQSMFCQVSASTNWKWPCHLSREFGEEAFKVERVGDAHPVSPELKATGAA